MTKPDLFIAWLQAHGLPTPVREYAFAKHLGRRWRFDYAWPRFDKAMPPHVALEVEGGVFMRGRHTRGAGFVADLAKYNAAALAGWIVLRYTPQQLTSPQTLSDLKAVLG